MGLVVKNGAPGEIRTPDQVVRSHLLYPAELRVRVVSLYISMRFKEKNLTLKNNVPYFQQHFPSTYPCRVTQPLVFIDS